MPIAPMRSTHIQASFDNHLYCCIRLGFTRPSTAAEIHINRCACQQCRIQHPRTAILRGADSPRQRRARCCRRRTPRSAESSESRSVQFKLAECRHSRGRDYVGPRRDDNQNEAGGQPQREEAAAADPANDDLTESICRKRRQNRSDHIGGVDLACCYERGCGHGGRMRIDETGYGRAHYQANFSRRFPYPKIRPSLYR